MTTQGPARYVTIAALPNSPVYSNGNAGVGATLTDTGMNVLTIDTETPTLYSRVLVKDQANAEENGLYYVSELGVAGVAPWVLTRATDYDTPDKINTHDPVAAIGSPTYPSFTFYNTEIVAVIGTDPITFDIYSVNTSYPGPESTILVSDPTGLLSPVVMSGDVTMDSTGAAAISADVNLPGDPTTTTQAPNDNSTKIATTAYVDAAVSGGGSFPAAGYAPADQTITSSSLLTLAHGLGTIPVMINVGIVCQTADVGYSVGDVIWEPSSGYVVNMGLVGIVGRNFTVSADATNIYITTSAAGIAILNKSTAAPTGITLTNWKYIVRAWA